MEMQNIKITLLINLKKGISTAYHRINKGLKGKKLAYALRYIKGAKNRINKIIKELKKSTKINNENKKVESLKKSTKINNENKKVESLKKSTKINNENKKVAYAIMGMFKNLINKIKEIKREKEREKNFLKRWEDLEEWDRWEDWYE